jgi:hypothetical protein
MMNLQATSQNPQAVQAKAMRASAGSGAMRPSRRERAMICLPEPEYPWI